MHDFFNENIITMGHNAEKMAKKVFDEIENNAEINTYKVMRAFRKHKVAEVCFAGTTGYGYDDLGRDTLDKIYAEIFHTESALVRINYVNGTHALASALYSMVGPGDTLLAATGIPYDTLRNTIGINGERFGSLAFYGVKYSQIDLLPDGKPDIDGVINAIKNDPSVKAVHIQRSRGYSERPALTVGQIGKLIKAIKNVRSEIYVMVDNCYGEFTETVEPTDVGADIIAGSLIKNPGGGIAPAGAYIAGKKLLVERAAERLTCPGIGGECGASLGNNRLLFQGLFMAPHIVAQALKTAVFCSAMMKLCGMETFPSFEEKRSDIIQSVTLKSPELMKKFCKGIQMGAPVDSFVTPEPWQMPGYDCPVIMAAGAFVQGSSIELSADGPFTEPYRIFVQGGLTYESGKYGIMMAVQEMLE